MRKLQLTTPAWQTAVCQYTCMTAWRQNALKCHTLQVSNKAVTSSRVRECVPQTMVVETLQEYQSHGADRPYSSASCHDSTYTHPSVSHVAGAHLGGASCWACHLQTPANPAVEEIS
jgi:hypothetical protein